MTRYGYDRRRRHDFSDLPVRLIPLYLEYFDGDGHLSRRIPKALLELIAQRFAAFLMIKGDGASVDQAFGGQTVRQRNALQRSGWRSSTPWVAYGEEPAPKLIFAHEVGIHHRLFAQCPLWIVRLYLESFGARCDQLYAVPTHVLEALADALCSFWTARHPSLDLTFGGQVGRRRNAILDVDRQFDVSFEVFVARHDARKTARGARSKSTPTEIAVANAANTLGLDEENVRRLFKKAATPGRKI